VNHPVRSLPTVEQLLEDLSFLDDWEERYRYIIDLGKRLPAMDPGLKNEMSFLPGCQSQVWIHARQDASAGTLHFDCDSDAFIVKGLLALVMAACDDKSPAEILAFDMDAFFARIGLLKHLSPTRGNGLRSMVKRIRAEAGQCVKAS
jgi:cysteine desulfuration protein SufE